jgi:hypothetical protein
VTAETEIEDHLAEETATIVEETLAMISEINDGVLEVEEVVVEDAVRLVRAME